MFWTILAIMVIRKLPKAKPPISPAAKSAAAGTENRPPHAIRALPRAMRAPVKNASAHPEAL